MMNPEDKAWTLYATHPETGELLQMNLIEAHERRTGTPLMQNGPSRNFGLFAQGGTSAVCYYASFNRND